MKKYLTLGDFLSRYNSQEACLEEIIRLKYPEGVFCPKCGKVRKHYKLKNRTQYSCGHCGHQFSPLKGTIFENSKTPLVYWFYAMFVMIQTRSGLSACQLQRELGVTYKTAWTMLHTIRTLMREDQYFEKGIVEIDETYIGGNFHNNFRKIYIQGQEKEPVMGIVKRKGSVKMIHLPGTGKVSFIKPILKYVGKDVKIMTDQHRNYDNLYRYGYKHKSVLHRRHFKVGNCYTQNIENVWSHFKRGIEGVYRGVSKKHLQKYADEFSYRYNHRNDPNAFSSLLSKGVKTSKKHGKSSKEETPPDQLPF